MNLTMKLLVLLLSLLLIHNCSPSDGHRIQLSDSILDFINTRHVERVLAERRMNASGSSSSSSTARDEKRYLVQNDLLDDAGGGGGGGVDGGDGADDDQLYAQTPEVAIDFDFNGRRQSGIGMIPSGSAASASGAYNETGFQYQSAGSAPNADILADLQAFRGDKLLKSSKNALVVTRKEYLKKDWCKTEPLVQRIREEGCLSRTIINRFCYGQCNSFYIPKSPKRRRHHGQEGGRGRGGNRHGHHGNHHSNAAGAALPPREVDLDFEDEDLTGPAFRSCAFCKPKKFTWITVTLRCPSLVPQLRRKRIQRIKQCKCIAEPLN
ncbi:gremlin-1-like [Uranotaenia lowii]|uniref:gremlin-1-like n=1 Tax=Uranotaenia lowii TaxID=190385 RepID=UPI00247A6189|nr:gremlin-1-like [Uranotaenia lowii]